MLVLAGALALAAGAALATLELGGDDQSSSPSEALDVTLDGSGVVAIDPRTGASVAAVPLGAAPANVAVGEGRVWVLDADDRTISKVDPSERVVLRTFGTGSTPTNLAVGAGAIWIGNGGFPTSISRIDPVSGVVDATIPLPGSGAHGYFQGGGLDRQLIAVTKDAVWVVNPDQTVSRIDPRSNDVVAEVADVFVSGIAADAEGVWVVDEEGVAEIDPRTNKASESIEVAADSLTALALGDGAVWAADPLGGNVWRIDQGPDPLPRAIPVGVGVGWVAFGEGSVWATNELADTVHRIDPSTNRAQVVSRMAAPAGVAVGEGRVWVTSAGPPPADAALPAPPVP